MSNLPPSYEIERLLARQKSYTYACVVVMLLYCLLWVPGVIANYLFLKEAERMEGMAGEPLPGAGWLRFMWATAVLLAMLFFFFVVYALWHRLLAPVPPL